MERRLVKLLLLFVGFVVFIPLNIASEPTLKPRPPITVTPNGTIPLFDPQNPVIPLENVVPAALDCVEDGEVVPCEVGGQDD